MGSFPLSVKEFKRQEQSGAQQAAVKKTTITANSISNCRKTFIGGEGTRTPGRHTEERPSEQPMGTWNTENSCLLSSMGIFRLLQCFSSRKLGWLMGPELLRDMP